MTDREGAVQHVNRQARELFGLAADADVEGKPVADVLPSGRLRETMAAVGRDLAKGGFRDVDLSDETTRKFVRVSASAVVSPSRASDLGVVYALRDVTLERELEQMKDDFLHYITHDLRNPLGSAMGFLDVLLKGTAGVLNPDQHSIVSSVRRSTSRLMALIN